MFIKNVLGIVIVSCLVIDISCQSGRYFNRNCPYDRRNRMRKCKLFVEDGLDFNEFRSWTSRLGRSIKVSLEVSCGPNGWFFLPWPMKARGLTKLDVNGCGIEGFFTEFNVTNRNLVDELKDFSLKNCVLMADVDSIYDIIYKPVSKEYDCGQQSLSRVVRRNISYTFPDLNQQKLSIEQANLLMSSGDELIKKARQKRYTCRYSNLEYIDESISRSRSKLFLRFMTAYSEYPKLKTFMISSNGYKRIPPVLVDWVTSFPQLSYLDMSYNNVAKFDFLGTTVMRYSRRRGPLVVNLSHNSVTTIPLNIEDYITGRAPIIVDLTGNPLRCNCNFLRYKRYVTSVVRKYRKYKRLLLITCSSGRSRRRYRLSTYKNNNCVF